MKQSPNFLQAPAVQDLDPHLNPNYNFENFIEGYSNKLSRSVAEAVALKPGGTAFNPLFLYGASGVGKTHLANAIGTKIKEIYPEKESCTYRHIYSKCNIQTLYVTTQPTTSLISIRPSMY